MSESPRFPVAHVNVLTEGERFCLATFAGNSNGKGYDCFIQLREKIKGGSRIVVDRFIMYHPTLAGARAWCIKHQRIETNAILNRKGMVEVDGVPVAR